MSETQQDKISNHNDKIPGFLRKVLDSQKNKQKDKKDSPIRYGFNIMISKRERTATNEKKEKSIIGKENRKSANDFTDSSEEDIDDSINNIRVNQDEEDSDVEEEQEKTTEEQEKAKEKSKSIPSSPDYPPPDMEIRPPSPDYPPPDKNTSEEIRKASKDSKKGDKHLFYLSNRSEFVSFMNKR